MIMTQTRSAMFLLALLVASCGPDREQELLESDPIVRAAVERHSKDSQNTIEWINEEYEISREGNCARFVNSSHSYFHLYCYEETDSGLEIVRVLNSAPLD